MDKILFLYIIFIGIIAILVMVLLWWLLITTEGVYLGRRVVIWLYDIYASRYDRIKDINPTHERAYLSRPIRRELADNPHPLILDVATGTARLAQALFRQGDFAGRIVSLDLSRKMLLVAGQKLPHELAEGRLILMHGPAECLPFPNESFDLVSCLEALEFMMSPRAVLREIVRVARPGAVLVLTNRQGQEARMMPGKTMSHDAFQAMLETEFGLEVAIIDDSWLSNYALIWAYKRGNTLLGEINPLRWQCPCCQTTNADLTAGDWICDDCGYRIPIGAGGILELKEM